MPSTKASWYIRFQSTLPVWGATLAPHRGRGAIPISIHAPRVGSDVQPVRRGNHQIVFQSTLPVWGATRGSAHRRTGKGISIHAPRVGSDSRPQIRCFLPINFNPRSPWGERRIGQGLLVGGLTFQSTLPVGGATEFLRAAVRDHQFQSTLPVWGATTTRTRYQKSNNKDFNPRSPCGERRVATLGRRQRGSISIHAPRVGSDGLSRMRRGNDGDFNPRSPCGERLTDIIRSVTIRGFQSTLPVWGATPTQMIQPYGTTLFQSTLPVWGATPGIRPFCPGPENFNPRSPCGERPLPVLPWAWSSNFNPRSPCGERLGRRTGPVLVYHFNPRSPCGERPET